jgi:hypothetical protein
LYHSSAIGSQVNAAYSVPSGIPLIPVTVKLLDANEKVLETAAIKLGESYKKTISTEAPVEKEYKVNAKYSTNFGMAIANVTLEEEAPEVVKFRVAYEGTDVSKVSNLGENAIMFKAGVNFEAGMTVQVKLLDANDAVLDTVDVELK